MIVRNAEAQDKIPVIELLKEFHRESGVPFPFQAAYAERLFFTHTLRPDACCLVVGHPCVGVLMGHTFDHPLGWGKWAEEKILYVTRAYRRDGVGDGLLDVYEAWAAEQGCVVAGAATLAGNDVSRMYERRGYSAAETHFIKVF